MSSGVEPAHFSSYNFSMSDALPLTALVESFVEAANPQKQQRLVTQILSSYLIQPLSSITVSQMCNSQNFGYYIYARAS